MAAGTYSVISLGTAGKEDPDLQVTGGKLMPRPTRDSAAPPLRCTLTPPLLTWVSTAALLPGSECLERADTPQTCLIMSVYLLSQCDAKP